MKELDINLYFGIGNGYTAEDEASSVEFSDELYSQMKEVFALTGETYLEEYLEEDLTPANKKELKKIIANIREELIEVQYANGDDVDPDTGEEYDFSEMTIEMEIVIPNDWEE